MRKKHVLIKKTLIFGILVLFIGICANPSSGLIFERESSNPLSNRNILYVGGSGPGNYSIIQEAIDASYDGDTIFVYDDSSPYNENLNVDKSISLIGENKQTTVINGIEHEIAVNISSDNVVVSGFTIQNYDNRSGSVTGLISIYSNYNVISDNIILAGFAWIGVLISESEYNIIFNNIISSSIGIDIKFGENNNISANIIKDCNTGIEISWYSNNNVITRNNLINNTWGITTGFFSINDIISYNNITHSYYGLIAHNCFNYKITNNNFMNNFVNARYGYLLIGVISFGFEFKSLRYIRSTINWNGNYWGRPRSIPKPIFGRLPPSGYIPWVSFDWHPAKEPYDIDL
jgi:hypothetical protein